MAHKPTTTHPIRRNGCKSIGGDPVPQSGLNITFDESQGDHAGGPRYFVGVDRACTFRERIQQIYADNREVTQAVAELDDYFSDPDFVNRPEVRHFTGRVARSIGNPRMAEEVAGEVVNQGYIIALKRLGYRDAPLNVTFSRKIAKAHGTCLVDAFMFGPGGAARMAFADWLIEEKLHGMHRPGQGPGYAFTQQTRKIWRQAEYKHRPWPQTRMRDGESIFMDMPAEQGKFPEGVEQVLRDSWRRYLYQGKKGAYTGMRPLRCGQNFQMVEDMVGALLDGESRPKLYCCPLDRAQRLRYDQIVETANRQGVDPFYAVYVGLFDHPDHLRPFWDRARHILYEYSGLLRRAAIQAGLIESPKTIGITRSKSQKAWQAQIVVKGRQRYLGLFKNKTDAQAAYHMAAAKMGHIPGLPDINKIWPTWEQEKVRLAQMSEHPRMPIIYSQQDTHKERKFGLRPPEAMRSLVERMKRVNWLVRHSLLVFDDDWPAASTEITIQSRGQRWHDKIKQRGQRFVIQGCTAIDNQTGRIAITIYQPGFDHEHVLAEEVYHIAFGILRSIKPAMYQAMHRWHERCLKKGADPTVCLDEAFSKSMALEESGVMTDLPRYLVKQAQRLFSPACRIPDSVMAEVKAGWSLP